jgi:hypothetical protein
MSVLSILHSMLLSVLHSTLHKAHDSEEDSDHPRLRSLWVFFSGWNERSRVVFEFLVTMRARIRVEEIAEFNATMRTFRSAHSISLPNVERHKAPKSNGADTAPRKTGLLFIRQSIQPAKTARQYFLGWAAMLSGYRRRTWRLGKNPAR